MKYCEYFSQKVCSSFHYHVHRYHLCTQKISFFSWNIWSLSRHNKNRKLHAVSTECTLTNEQSEVMIRICYVRFFYFFSQRICYAKKSVQSKLINQNWMKVLNQTAIDWLKCCPKSMDCYRINFNNTTGPGTRPPRVPILFNRLEHLVLNGYGLSQWKMDGFYCSKRWFAYARADAWTLHSNRRNYGREFNEICHNASEAVRVVRLR